MTNKSLSEKICEACGIAPKYLVKYTYFGQQENIYETFEEAKQEKEMLKGEIEEAYPDFENNNNNFVKMLEIFHKNNFYIYINDISINCVIEKETFVIYFLKYLINLLKDETVSEKVKDVLKQAIKNEQWEI